jgi:hypothetical protein
MKQCGSSDLSGTIDRRRWYSMGVNDEYDADFFFMPLFLACDKTLRESVQEHNRTEPAQMTNQTLKTAIGHGPIFISKTDMLEDFHMNQFIKVGSRNTQVTFEELITTFLHESDCDGSYIAGLNKEQNGNFTYYTPEYKVY